MSWSVIGCSNPTHASTLCISQKWYLRFSLENKTKIVSFSLSLLWCFDKMFKLNILSLDYKWKKGNGIDFSFFPRQTAGMDKPTERGYWEAAKTASQEETSILQQLPNTNHKLRAKATQNQGSEWSRKWSLSKTQPTSAVSPGLEYIKRYQNNRSSEIQRTICKASLTVCSSVVW